MKLRWWALAATNTLSVANDQQAIGGIEPRGSQCSSVTKTSYLDLLQRALPDNGRYGYTPQTNPCPSPPPAIRPASSLSDQETSWLSNRRPATIDPMKDLLNRANIVDLDVDSYFTNLATEDLPNIGIAISGGGYRAMLNGAGVLEAFDSRTPGSTSPGQLGGLLQSATYLAGLSGGSWLVGSLYANNFTSIDEVLALDTATQDLAGIWQLGNSIFEGPASSGIQAWATTKYYAALLADVTAKKTAGYGASITDFWGRALSYQLVNATNGGPSYTFSSIADQDWFQAGEVPLPLIIADARAPGEVLVSSNTTVFTFNPWELGSEDPTVYAFAPLKYVGTNFSDGSPTTVTCVTGYDNVGFVMGTSSSFFNAVLTTIGSNNIFASALRKALMAVYQPIGASNIDISVWRPNPFYTYKNGRDQKTLDTELTLVDGGEDGQNIPLHPLIQPDREVDVIFAVDSSADTNDSFPTSMSAEDWPAGTSLIATYQRSLSSIANGTGFPTIPDQNTFLNLGLNNKPAFFGCGSNQRKTPFPLIVYLPNAPYTYKSNFSTLEMSYADSSRNAMVSNGYALATQLNGTLDSEWPACVGCAILSRSLERTGTRVPSGCARCFTRYCWNGTVVSSKPGNYIPVMKSG